MNTSIITADKESKQVAVIRPERDAIHTNSALDTARAAAKYASQLSHEYHTVLHRSLAMVDPKVAGRFHSLINELTTMTDLTLENVRFGSK